MAEVSSEKIVKDFLQKLIREIGLKAAIEVKEEDGVVRVGIVGDELGALIGYHGETLESLQHIVGLVLNQKLKSEGEWKRVVVDIGNWRAERNEALKNLVKRATEELQNKNVEKVTLGVMSPSQRREVHVIVSEDYPEITSQSEGEEPNRRVVLSLK